MDRFNEEDEWRTDGPSFQSSIPYSPSNEDHTSSLPSYSPTVQSRVLPSNNSSKCDNCKFRWRRSDAGEYPPNYCGPKCAKEASRAAVPTMSGSRSQFQKPLCSLSGCNNTATNGNYCNLDHARVAVTTSEAVGCNNCRELPRLKGRLFCSDECEKAMNKRPLPSLPPEQAPAPTNGSSSADDLIRLRFQRRWKDTKNDTIPQIHKVQEITLKKASQRCFDTCSQHYDDRGGHVIKSSFYGAFCGCSLASIDPLSAPCKTPTCRICQVIRLGFDSPPRGEDNVTGGKMYDNGRHGLGIYTRLNPAEAHQHGRAPAGLIYRVIIMCSVLVPKSQDTLTTKDPIVDDSGGVYCPIKDNIIPRWVIVYSVNNTRPAPPRIMTPPPAPKRDIIPTPSPVVNQGNRDWRDQNFNRGFDDRNPSPLPERPPPRTYDDSKHKHQRSDTWNADIDRPHDGFRPPPPRRPYEDDRWKDDKIADLHDQVDSLERDLLEAKAQIRLLSRLLEERDERNRETRRRERKQVKAELDGTKDQTRMGRSATLPSSRIRSSSLPTRVSRINSFKRSGSRSRSPRPAPSPRPVPNGSNSDVDSYPDSPAEGDDDDDDLFDISPPGGYSKIPSPARDRRSVPSPAPRKTRYSPARDKRRHSPARDKRRHSQPRRNRPPAPRINRGSESEFSDGSIPSDTDQIGQGNRKRDRFSDAGGLPDLPPFMAGGGLPPFPPNMPPFPPNGAAYNPFAAFMPINLPMCKFPNCGSQVKMETAKYCDNKHRKEAVRLGLEVPCLQCKELPRSLSQFCGRNCLEAAYSIAPVLYPLDASDPKYIDISKQFSSSWRHDQTTKPLPPITHIYKIVVSKDLMDKYMKYQNEVESRCKFVSRGIPKGNERRRWHGTTRACTLGDDPNNLVLCNQTACAVCCILKTSFKVSFNGASGNTFQRFGKGIYASSTSSKSHDYVKNVAVSPNHAVFLTTVTVGRGHKVKEDQIDKVAPPPGHDSVLGEVGTRLNHDEVVVYNDDAIRPAWLIIYKWP